MANTKTGSSKKKSTKRKNVGKKNSNKKKYTKKKVTKKSTVVEAVKKEEVVEQVVAEEEKKEVKKTTTKKKTPAKEVEEKKEIKEEQKVEKKKSTPKKKTTTKKKTPVKKEVEEKKEEVVEEPKEVRIVEETEEVVLVEPTKEEVVENEVIPEEVVDTELVEEDDKKYINKYLIFFFMAIVFVVVLLTTTKIAKKVNTDEISFDKISLKEYLKMYDKVNDESEFVYLSSDDCIGCDSYETNLKRLEDEYKIKIKELNVTNMSSEDMNKIRESNLFLSDSIEVPALLSIKDSNGISGIKEYNALKRFIEYSKNPAGASFVKVSLSKYLNLLKSKDKTVIYIGESGDSTCEAYSKTLESVSAKNGIKVYYLNTNEIITEENWEKLNNSNEIFSKMWFKPVTLIVKNGEIVDYRMESMGESDLAEFFTKNGL